MWSRKGTHGTGIGLKMLVISTETRSLPFLCHRVLGMIPELCLLFHGNTAKLWATWDIHFQCTAFLEVCAFELTGSSLWKHRSFL